MKNLVKKLLVVGALSSASMGSLAAAQAPVAPAAQAADLSPFIRELASPAVGNPFSQDDKYVGFLNLVLQLHYEWVKMTMRHDQQLVEQYNRSTDADKVALLKLMQAFSDDAFKDYLKTGEGRRFLGHYASIYGWQNELNKLGVFQFQASQKSLIIWTELSDNANLMINSQKLDLYNPIARKAILARQPAPAPQPASVPDPARHAALVASGVLSDERCGVIAQRSGNGFTGAILIPAGDDAAAIAAAVKDDFDTEVLQESLKEESVAKRPRLGRYDDDEKKAN